MKESKITIQKASAGSGKTESLATRYAGTLISEYQADKDAYKHIMAVTFTNAATNEMKERILGKLHAISCDASDNDSAVAKDILRRIVNDYTMFRVSTIDSFFQSILKSFALELGSSAAFQVSIDDKSVVDAAIDSLYAGLGEDRAFLEDLVRMYQEQIAEGNSWNYKGTISSVSEEITRESYRKLGFGTDGENSPAREALQPDYQSIRREISAYLNRGYPSAVNRLAADIAGMRQRFDLGEKEFMRSSTSALFKAYSDPYLFLNGGKGDIDRLLGYIGSDRWFKKTSDPAVAEQEARLKDEFTALLISFRDKEYSKYLTYRAINETINITSLFARIKSEMVEYCRREQISLLSDAPDILCSLISGSDTPFVYEKIGTSLRHYLLDEFQDTSSRQWMNFRPLLKESADKGHGSFIVGDVKQSIYSFRGADWSILNRRLAEEFRQDQIETERLEYNYRSLRRIVGFNNDFFSFAVGTDGRPGELCADLSDAVSDGWTAVSSAGGSAVDDTGGAAGGTDYTAELRGIYSDVSQKVARDDSLGEGFVSLITTDIPMNKRWRDECAMFDMRRKIAELTGPDGKYGCYRKSDIVILVSSNREAAEVTRYLTQEWRPSDCSVARPESTAGIKVISSDAMYLSASKSVTLIVSVLAALNDPSDKSLELLVSLGQLGGNPLPVVREGIEEISAREYHTLYELCDAIIASPKCFSPELRREVPFISSFMDRVLAYTVSYGSNTGAFLEWWKKESENFAIPAPSDEDAVCVMTMHKAKGLSAKVVFIPFLREGLNRISGRYWMRPDSGEFSGTGFGNTPFLVSPTSSFLKTGFRDDYKKTLVHGAIDTFNLAYVSFTRAKERMYIYMAPEAGSLELSKYLKSFADARTSEPDGSDAYGWRRQCDEEVIMKVRRARAKADDPEQDVHIVRYNYGEATPSARLSGAKNTACGGKGENSSRDDSLSSDLSAYQYYPSVRGALRSMPFGKEDDIRHKGILLHEAYSYLDDPELGNPDDRLIAAAERFILANPSYGILGRDAEEIAELMRGQIESVSEYNWFSGDYISVRESEILDNGQFWRPDRVLMRPGSREEAIVIDYKFGEYSEAGLAKYRSQVRRYMELLRKMDFKEVRGYLWYVISGKVIEVSL